MHNAAHYIIEKLDTLEAEEEERRRLEEEQREQEQLQRERNQQEQQEGDSVVLNTWEEQETGEQGGLPAGTHDPDGKEDTQHSWDNPLGTDHKDHKDHKDQKRIDSSGVLEGKGINVDVNVETNQGDNKMSVIDLDAGSITMQPGSSGFEPAGRLSPNPGNQPRKSGLHMPQCLKTCCMYIRDNRLETGSEETKRKLKQQNKTQDQTNLCLKKVLNVIFVTTGVSLFLAIVVVIIYTSIG